MTRIPQQQALMGDKCLVCGKLMPAHLDPSRGRRSVYMDPEGTLVRENAFRSPKRH